MPGALAPGCFYLIHDFWKKFAAVQPKNEQCGNSHSMSVEAFVVIAREPDINEEGVNWGNLPDGAKERAMERARLRGLVARIDGADGGGDGSGGGQEEAGDGVDEMVDEMTRAALLDDHRRELWISKHYQTFMTLDSKNK